MTIWLKLVKSKNKPICGIMISEIVLGLIYEKGVHKTNCIGDNTEKS